MIRCEVCDDTNATIHCQECRRNTCEECDEILHLVEANKSHHRIPLFSSRNGSRKGSYAPTRAVSPRGTKKTEDVIPEYPLKSQNDTPNGVERLAWSNNVDNASSFPLRGGVDDNGPNVERNQPLAPAAISSNANTSLYQASRQVTSAVTEKRVYSEQTTEPHPLRERAQPPPPPPASYQGQAVPSHQAAFLRPSNVSEYENSGNLSNPTAGHHGYLAQKQNNSHSAPQNSARTVNPAPAVHPTYRVNHMEPMGRSISVQQPNNIPIQQQGRTMANPNNQQSNQYPPSRNEQFQPLLPYQQAGRVPNSSVVHGQSKSGTTTPAVTARTQLVGARSVPHSGHATPTYGGNFAQRYNATGGAIPLNQWNEPSQPRMVERSRQSPFRDREPQQAVKQQALAQHLQVIEQHRAVEAHQRMMAQKQQQSHARARQAPPLQASQQSYGYVFSSVPTSLAPSARNSPPMYPQAPPQFISIPTLDSGFIYGHMAAPHPMYPGMPQPLPQFLPQPMGHPWAPQHHQIYYQTPSNAMPTQRPPPPPPYDTSVPHGLQGYAPLQSFQQQHTMNFAPVHPYQMPRSGMMTPYHEPRTPYHEPRSPANEPSGWTDRQVYSARYTASPLKQQQMVQHQQRRPTQQMERAQPVNHDSQKKVAPPMLAGRWDMRPNQQQNVREDFVMTPNGSVARMPVDNRSHFSGRYDPDEAEARVRSLIADTERMLVGLSSGGGSGSPGLAV